MFVPRQLSESITQLMSWFPVVSVTGPRQSGKSTLLREMFPSMTYLNLEDPGLRALAAEDPIGFLNSQPSPLIIDEAQHVPQLFSAVQLRSDEVGTPGQYILSGSQNFLLMESITQSLAGRVGISHLLPFGYGEVKSAVTNTDVDDFMVRGGYPRLYDVDIPSDIYFENYVRTYLERDVSGLLNVRNLEDFRRFLNLCAQQAGTLVNFTSLSNELDVVFRTAKDWVSILESSFITMTLPGYHSNPRKSLTKTPKLYFYDTGLLCFLLGINSIEQLMLSPHRGAVFENFVITETAKKHLHAGRTPKLYFYRDDSKREIDLLDFTLNQPKALEIKASQTFNSKYTRHLSVIGEELGIDASHRAVVYRGTHSAASSQAQILSIKEYLDNL